MFAGAEKHLGMNASHGTIVPAGDIDLPLDMIFGND
jgi:hypothetical protein